METSALFEPALPPRGRLGPASDNLGAVAEAGSCAVAGGAADSARRTAPGPSAEAHPNRGPDREEGLYRLRPQCAVLRQPLCVRPTSSTLISGERPGVGLACEELAGRST